MGKDLVLLEELEDLEVFSRTLALSSGARKLAQHEANTFVNDFLDGLDQKDQVIWREEEKKEEDDVDGVEEEDRGGAAAAAAAAASMAIAEKQHTVQELLDHLRDNVLRSGCNTASGADMAYVPSGGLHLSAVADFVVASVNRACGVNFIAPGIAKLEKELIAWSCSVIGYPDTALGTFTSGGSVATLIALCSAKDAFLSSGNSSIGRNSSSIGNSWSSSNMASSSSSRSSLASSISGEGGGSGGSNLVVYMTSQTHTCVSKVLRTIGVSKYAVTIFVEVDEGYRMCPHALRRQVERDLRDGLQPFLVVATCGTTNTGAIDPLEEISKVCRQFNLWLHADAAYGGFFSLLDEMRTGKMRSLCLADSVVLDPHKTLFVPYGCGIVLVREGHQLVESFRMDEKSSYLAHDLESYREMAENPCNLSLELSRPFRGLKMWLPLQVHGAGPFKACLKEKLLLTKYFFQEVQKIGFVVGPVPELSICIHRYLPRGSSTTTPAANDFNQRLLETLRKDGRIFVSSTILDGVFWLRVCILQMRTHREHVESYLYLLQVGLKSLMEEGSARDMDL